MFLRLFGNTSLVFTTPAESMFTTANMCFTSHMNTAASQPCTCALRLVPVEVMTSWLGSMWDQDGQSDRRGCDCLSEGPSAQSDVCLRGKLDAQNYFRIWNGQHRHLRQLTDSVDFWVIITHRNAGHVRLWSAERCHVVFKLPPLSCSPASGLGAKDFCPSTLQTSCLCHFIRY